MTEKSLTPSEFKAACNRVHARRRFAERYGQPMSGGELRAIEAMIRAGTGADVVMLRPDHRSEHRMTYGVRWEGRWILPVYDSATASVITFLPEDLVHVFRPVLEPAAEPPKPAPKTSGIPIGTVTGFVDLARFEPSPPRLPDDLPPNPEPPGEDASVEELGASLSALSDRVQALVALAPTAGPVGAAVHAELKRLADLRREWKRRRHDVNRRRWIDALEATEEADPIGLLRLASSTMVDIASATGKPFTATQQAAFDRINAFLIHRDREARGEAKEVANV